MPYAVRLPHASLTLVCGMLALGCAQLDLNQSIPWIGSPEDEPAVPAKVVAVWTDAILHQPDNPPTRGFGGRLMFYSDEFDKSIPVNGTLIVYAFDEEGRRPTDAKPDRKYVFPTEHFAQHHSKSELGHSYSVWLPWDEIGGPPKEISLIARFLPSEGPPIVGEQTKHFLPGIAKPVPTEHADAPHQDGSQAVGQNPVRPASHQATRPAVEQKWEAARSTRQMRTHTIPVPANFGRRAPRAVVRPRSTAREMSLHRSARATSAAEQPAPSASPSKQTPPPAPRPTRFSRPRPQARAAPTARPTHDRAPWQPRHATWPSYRQPEPQPATGTEVD